MERNSVVIVGSGRMGAGIAACAAAAGERVILTDRNLESAVSGAEKAKETVIALYENELITQEQYQKAGELILAEEKETALAQAQFVIEAVYEDLGLKQELFQELDTLLPPEVVIASNTSGLRITEIADRTTHPERCVTTHFWFPAHLIPLVEVVIGDRTEEKYAIQTKERLALWGKKPVLVKKDLPGQLANRILQAVIREAVNIVQIGLASPEDVDMAVKMGMGIRFPAWGPLEHVDAVGIDLCTSVQDSVLPEISSEKQALPFMRSLLENGDTGYKSGRGFYDWSVKDMDKLTKKRDDFIIQALKALREE